MKKFTCFLTSFFLVLNLYTQENHNKIVKLDGSRKYYYNYQKLNRKDLKELLQTYPESEAAYKKSRNSATVSNCILGTSLVLTTLRLGETIYQVSELKKGRIVKTSGPGLMTVGLALQIFAMPFLISSNVHEKKAVKIFNKYKSFLSYDNNLLKLGLNKDGVCLSFNF